MPADYKKSKLYKNLNRKISQLKEDEELHYRDYFNSGTALSALTRYVSLTDLIAQGDGATNRDGNEVIVTSLKLKGEFTILGTTYSQYAIIRMIVVQKLLGNIVLQDLLASTSGTDIPLLDDSVVTTARLAPYYYQDVESSNVGAPKAWKVLYDDTFIMRPNGDSVVAYNQIYHYDIDIPMHRHQMSFLGAGTAPAEYGDVGVFIIATPSSSQILWQFAHRIYFHP